jgi:glycosyltransferase involved in cell wall biosynthesis
MRRVLVLSPCDVFPPVHGSSTAIYHTLQYLCQANQVSAVLCYLYSQRGQPDLESPNLAIRYSPESRLDRLGYKGLLCNPLYYRTAWHVARHFKPDVIQAELLWTAPIALWLRRRTGIPVVLMQENVEYQKFVRFGLTSPFLRLVKWLEGWACNAADRVVALSEVDRDFMIDLYGVPPERFALIPHGVDPDLFDFRPEGAARARQKLGLAPDVPILTFVGKLDYTPNVRAVKSIARLIAPAVWEQYPEARFVIIGQGGEDLPEYGAEGLLFPGFVDARANPSTPRADPSTPRADPALRTTSTPRADPALRTTSTPRADPALRTTSTPRAAIHPNLSDYLSASDVVLVPLDSGSGTRLKIVEAAANARPVVSTIIGAEGQSFVDGQEILLAGEVDASFVEATLRLLADPGLRQRLGRAARAKVLDRYSWRAQVDKMEEVFGALGV